MPPNPARTKSITDFVDRLSKDPARHERLKRARVRVADLTAAEADPSLRAMRLRAGLSQVDVARLISTSQSHIARIENGTLEPTIDTCRRLAKAFQVDMNTIDKALVRRGTD